MKLYATVTSEVGKPATKGGQEYLDIDITVGDARNPIVMSRLTVKYTDRLDDYGIEEEGAGYVLVDDDNNAISWYNTTMQTLGER